MFDFQRTIFLVNSCYCFQQLIDHFLFRKFQFQCIYICVCVNALGLSFQHKFQYIYIYICFQQLIAISFLNPSKEVLYHVHPTYPAVSQLSPPEINIILNINHCQQIILVEHLIKLIDRVVSTHNLLLLKFNQICEKLNQTKQK